MRALWPWIAFNAAVLAILAADLGLFNRTAHRITLKEAALWISVWITLALALGAGIFVFVGAQAGTEFFTGYLIEYSLSVDNIFVFVLIFSAFGTEDKHQHRVLFWGIIGALVMRGAMIGAGVALITRFHWVLYVFGAFLVVTGVRMVLRGEVGTNPEANPVLTFIRRFVPIWPQYEGEQFFCRKADDQGVVRTKATPLFVVLLLIEIMDLVFAVDSIPAVFSVTQDPFIVYTSNVCAILGLRSLYFLLAGMLHRIRYLKYGLAAVLAFVGAKMLASRWYDLPTSASLGVISFTLGVSVMVSLLSSKGEAR